MAIGKLYKSDDEQFMMEISYRFQNESPTSWWGELTLIEYGRISDGSGYVIELDDARRGRCSLSKRVNRATTGVPPRYIYHFTGTGMLDSAEE